MNLMTPIPAAVLTVLLTACATSGPAEHVGAATSTSASAMHTSAAMRATTSDDGTVTGTFTRVGGPLLPTGKQPRPVPLPGTVIFSASHHRMVAVRVGKSGRFSVSLLAGSYLVIGRSPAVGGASPSGALSGPPCSPPAPVDVVARHTVHVSVVCTVP